MDKFRNRVCVGDRFRVRVGGKGGWRVKNFFPHPNELLIWAYPKNLLKIGPVEDEL